MNTKIKDMLPGRLATICLISFCFSLSSCKKLLHIPDNENELKATVQFSSGQIVTINATESAAFMDCQFDFVIQNQQYPAAGLALDIHNASYNCITSAGTYYAPYFSCSFGTAGTQSVLYSNTGVTNPGSITFTSFSDSKVECYFSSVCKNNVGDSVIINGTFKGNHMGY